MSFPDDAPCHQRQTGSSSGARRILRACLIWGALLSTLLILFHSIIPDVMGLSLWVDSAAPWYWLAVPALLVLALMAKSRVGVAAVLVPAVAWLAIFGPGIVPLAWGAPEAAAHQLTISSQNIEAGTGAAAASALALAESDVISLQELDAGSAQSVAAALIQTHPYSFVVGTVGLWSKYPLSDSQPLDLGLGWKRALTTQVETESGSVRLYAVHAASARQNEHGNRDRMLAQLAGILRADQSPALIAVGDFNATSTDRAFSALTGTLDEPNQDQGMFGFSWPREPFAALRLDHVLQRGLEVTSNTTLPAGESDHLAVRATVNLPGS